MTRTLQQKEARCRRLLAVIARLSTREWKLLEGGHRMMHDPKFQDTIALIEQLVGDLKNVSHK